MAKVYLDQLRKRYGASGWEGGRYRWLMRQICLANQESVARAVVRKNSSYLRTRAAKLREGVLVVPPAEEMMLPGRIYARKAAERGNLLSDSVRDRLSGALREAVDWWSVGEFQGKRGAERGRVDRRLVDVFEVQAARILRGQGKISNLRAIAETEVRSAVSEVKHQYAAGLVAANPNLLVVKRWVHRPHLSAEPREGHAEVDGVTRLVGEAFDVPYYVRRKKRLVLMATDRMQHPHDASARAEQVISCHCECDYELILKVHRMPEEGVVFKDRKLQGRTEFQGLLISIENRRGSVRSGTDPDGKPWQTKMFLPYGYIRGTTGADGDEVDCFVGPDKSAPTAYVFHTYRQDGSMQYDEDKVMLGFKSAPEARRWLELHYDRYVVRDVDPVPVTRLKVWLEEALRWERSRGKVGKSIAVDFDKTLAKYMSFRGSEEVGEPVPAMVDRVRRWLAEDRDVEIFTARVSREHPKDERKAAKKAIKRFCEEQFGQKLRVTADKSPDFEEFWDDKAVAVVPNEGERK